MPCGHEWVLVMQRIEEVATCALMWGGGGPRGECIHQEIGVWRAVKFSLRGGIRENDKHGYNRQSLKTIDLIKVTTYPCAGHLNDSRSQTSYTSWDFCLRLLST